MLSKGRRESRRQEIPMLRRHALCGASIVAVHAALLASTDVALAQSSDRVLPPVTVDAPQSKPQAARKPAQRTAAARTPSVRPANSDPSRLMVYPQDTGRASLGAPAAVTRYQLPQRSFSITAKEVEEQINL